MRFSSALKANATLLSSLNSCITVKVMPIGAPVFINRHSGILYQGYFLVNLKAYSKHYLWKEVLYAFLSKERNSPPEVKYGGGGDAKKRRELHAPTSQHH